MPSTRWLIWWGSSRAARHPHTPRCAHVPAHMHTRMHRALPEPTRALKLQEVGAGVLTIVITTVIKQELKSTMFAGSDGDTLSLPDCGATWETDDGGAGTEQNINSTHKKPSGRPEQLFGSNGIMGTLPTLFPQATPGLAPRGRPPSQSSASSRKPGWRMSCWDCPSTRPRRRGPGVGGHREEQVREQQASSTLTGSHTRHNVVPRAPRVSSASLCGLCFCHVPLRTRTPV